MADVEIAATPISTLRRRNSIGTHLVVPAKLTLPTKPHQASTFRITTSSFTTTSTTTSSSSTSSTQSFPYVDFGLVSIKPSSYTSLKDLLPSLAAVQSPTASYEISIRNRLVKRAAWAYLQPMSTSTEYTGRNIIHRQWTRLSDGSFKNPFTAVFRFITRAFDRLLRAIGFRSSR